jgi:hypothetical protein
MLGIYVWIGSIDGMGLDDGRVGLGEDYVFCVIKGIDGVLCWAVCWDGVYD